jgi:hypothetical protein
MNILSHPAKHGADFPTIEDAARAGDARRKLASRLMKSVPTTMTFQGAERMEIVSLPPLAVVALHMILAHLSAGRAVSIEAHDSEIEIDDAALLAGLAPLEFLESLTQLGLPLRADQHTGRVYISTRVLGQCLNAIHADQPEDLASGDQTGASEDWKKARALLTRRQWPFAERLVHDLRKAGNRVPPETYALDYYFGSRPLLGARPQSWPAIPDKKA